MPCIHKKLSFCIQNEDDGGTKEKKKGEVYLVWEAAGGECQRTISTQKLKLLGDVLGYDLYYSLTHPFK